MLLIMAAWIASFGSVPDPRLSALYGAGSLLLTLHSLALGDPVFTTLNAMATAIAIVNLFRWRRLSNARLRQR